MANIAERIATLRKQRGLTQRQLEQKTGINIGRLEAGMYNPQVATLERLAKALDVPLYELLKD